MQNVDYDQFLSSYMKQKTIKRRLAMVLPLVALLVILGVFWWLKLTGITLAGEAFCGHDEHAHTDDCYDTTLLCGEEHTHTDGCLQKTLLCEAEEHIHVSSCYSDITADVETSSDWEEMLKDVYLGNSPSQNVLAIANSQIRYEESSLNFKADDSGERFGYTRYGQWFGNPYGEWDTMFVSFCLRYAEVYTVPVSAGAESMKIQWEQMGLYKEASFYLSAPGDVVFLDFNEDSRADATAIVAEVSETHITVIQGDVNNRVERVVYERTDLQIMGFGTLSAGEGALLVGNMLSDGAVAPIAEGVNTLASAVDYSSGIFTQGSSYILYTKGTDGKYYAISGNGDAVEVIRWDTFQRTIRTRSFCIGPLKGQMHMMADLHIIFTILHQEITYTRM